MTAEPCEPTPLSDDSLRSLCTTICAEGLDDDRVHGLVLELLRDQFSKTVGRLQRAGYGKPQYKPREERSPIHIVSFFEYSKETMSGRPKILVRPGDVQSSNAGLIGDMVRLDVGTGERIYCKSQTGVTIVYCTSPLVAEAGLIAQEARDTLQQSGPILKDSFDFALWDVSGLGKPYQVQEELKPHYVRPLHVQWKFEYCWAVRPEAPETQRIVTSLTESR